MLRKNPSGHTPVVSTKAYIDPTAVIVDVSLFMIMFTSDPMRLSVLTS